MYGETPYEVIYSVGDGLCVWLRQLNERVGALRLGVMHLHQLESRGPETQRKHYQQPEWP